MFIVRIMFIVVVMCMIGIGEVFGDVGRVSNEMIYRKLVEIERRQAVFEERFKQIEKRFEDINKRFEDINKRFEDMNKRIGDVNKRIDEVVKLMGWVVGGLFILIGGVIGLLIWDRRTSISAALRESERFLESRYEVSKVPILIEVLRERARRDNRLAEILRSFNLL